MTHKYWQQALKIGSSLRKSLQQNTKPSYCKINFSQMSSTSALRVCERVCECVSVCQHSETGTEPISHVSPSSLWGTAADAIFSWKLEIFNNRLSHPRERQGRDVPHLAEQQAARRPSPPRDPRQRGPGGRSPTRTGRNIYPTAGKMKGRAEKGFFFFPQSPDVASNSAGQDQPLIICFQSLSQPFRCAEGNHAP